MKLFFFLPKAKKSLFPSHHAKKILLLNKKDTLHRRKKIVFKIEQFLKDNHCFVPKVWKFKNSQRDNQKYLFFSVLLNEET